MVFRKDSQRVSADLVSSVAVGSNTISTDNDASNVLAAALEAKQRRSHRIRDQGGRYLVMYQFESSQPRALVVWASL